MSILTDNKSARATKVWFEKNMLFVMLEDGREIGTPLEWFPKLKSAAKNELNNFRLIGNGVGIHWENLDEDISVKGLLQST